MTVLTGQRLKFGRMPGDQATYSVNDPDGAVRLARMAPVIACDIETGSAAGPGRWIVKAFSISDSSTSYVLDPRQHAGAIQDCLIHAQRLVFHNAAYDVPILVGAGLMDVDHIGKVYDTLVAARLGWPYSIATPNNLGALSDRLLGAGYGHLKSALEDGFKKVNPTASKAAMFDRLNIDSDAYTAYAAFDVILTARIYSAMPGTLYRQLNAGRPGFRKVDVQHLDDREQAINRMLLRRSALGIRLDDDAADAIVANLQIEANKHRRVLIDHGIDPDKPGGRIKSDVVAGLHSQGLLPSSWPILMSGKPSARRDWMDRLDDMPIVQSVVEMTRIQRFIKDYQGGSAAMSYYGRIHPQVGVLVAVTGRMSYSNPALQQYPSAVRGMFDFGEPCTSFDWSSIEPVVIGNLAKATDMLEPYEQGGDLYEPIARRANVDRKTAKVLLLALLYGQGAPALSLRLRITEDKARSLQSAIRAAMPEVTRLLYKVRDYGDVHGAIQTISGRIIPLSPDYRTGNQRFMGYKGGNYLVQGSAYDLLAEALYRMYQHGLNDYLFLAIHDELVVSTEVADEVNRIMVEAPQALRDAAGGRVPVLRVGRTDLGTHWKAKA